MCDCTVGNLEAILHHLITKKTMKGKYITTSLLLAVLAGGKNGVSVLVDETTAATQDHTLIWTRDTIKPTEKLSQMQDRDERKLA